MSKKLLWWRWNRLVYEVVAWLKTSVDLQHVDLRSGPFLTLTRFLIICTFALTCLFLPNLTLVQNGDRRCNRAGSGPHHFYFKGIFPEAEEAIEEYVGE